MTVIRRIAAALVCALVAIPLAIAAPPYTRNTGGTTSDGILDALTDIYNKSAGNVGGYTTVAVASFTRPANTTAYATGQTVANSTTAGSVTPMQFTVARTTGGSGMVRRARVTKSSTTLSNATFELVLYNASSTGTCPTSAAGDGATYSTDQAIRYIGRVSVTMDMSFTDGAKGIGTPAAGSEINFDTPTGYSILCGLTRAGAAYVPTSGETITWALETLPN